MPAEIVKQHYIALAKLLKTYRTEPLNKTLLKASHNVCKSLYETAKSHPNLIFAQPQLYKPQLPFIVNLAFNSTVLTCLLAVRNKFDPLVTIQLMCGSLSIYALEQSSIQKHYQTDAANEHPRVKIIGRKNVEFSQLLKAHQQHIWLSNYLLCSDIHLTQYPHTRLTSPITALAYMANKLALLCTPNKHRQPVSFAIAIKHLSLVCCSKWYKLLVPLLQYPSILPPGSYIRLANNAIHIVLSLSNKGLVTKPLPTKQSVKAQSNKADIQLISAQQVIQSYPSQPINSFARLSQWWGDELIDWLSDKDVDEQIMAFDSILPVQSPPASLLVIQDQLNHINADISMIVKAIEKEPTYAHQLHISASNRNRQKQSVNNIQHGLAMLGFEQTNSILLQHSLLNRLNQHYFPLQQRLLNFSQFFMAIASELATKTKRISPELASTTAYFAVSRLFTSPAIRTLTIWQSTKPSSFKIADLFTVKDSENLKHSGFLLATAWQQNQQVLAVLQHYDLIMQRQENKRSARQFCYLLGLSLTLAHEYYFSETTRSEETAAYCKAGLIELGINQTKLEDIMADVVSRTNVFCRLE